ncbi:MAG: hypothetical protein R2771_06280 [Saprospiraceae bacterium]
MIIVFLILGLLAAFFLFISYYHIPIKRISKNAQNLNLNSLDVEIIDNKPLKYKTIFNYYLSDEMDILFEKYSEMLVRLKANKKNFRQPEILLFKLRKWLPLVLLPSINMK